MLRILEKMHAGSETEMWAPAAEKNIADPQHWGGGGGLCSDIPVPKAMIKNMSIMSRVADPDPNWIRIQSDQWIRIRIRNPNPDPQK
jgi:hypothetical protein